MAVAWLMIAAGDNRQHAGNEGYDDDPASHYSWDDTVANWSRPQAGDFIVLWDTETLLGASVIEHIVEGDTTKVRQRCPSCGKTGIKERSGAGPRFRCYKCAHEFAEPVMETIAVHTRRTRHAAAWVDLGGRLDGATLRTLCLQPRSIQSLRELDWDRFVLCIGETESPVPLALIERAGRDIAGGHRTSTVRVRVGQRAFRLALAARFGNVCAFSGPQPAAALDAAHLYSYAETGEHHESGGLLLRRDLHRLFDLGLICVHPETKALDVHPDLMPFPQYSVLAGASLAVQLDRRALVWLGQHWKQHRG